MAFLVLRNYLIFPTRRFEGTRLAVLNLFGSWSKLGFFERATLLYIILQLMFHKITLHGNCYDYSRRKQVLNSIRFCFTN